MQYIQLQPQLAASVPSSSVGNQNLFLDIEDLIIKTKNDDGSIHKPLGYEHLPLSGVTALINTSGLTLGSFYNISDVNVSLYGGNNIILQAIAPNKLANKGFGIFYNPRYDLYQIWSNTLRIFEYGSINETNGLFQQGETIITDNGQNGNLVGLPGEANVCFTTTSTQFNGATSFTGESSGAFITFGLNSVSSPAYSIGTKVIWGGKVWINISGNIGLSVDGYSLDSTNWLVVDNNTTDYNVVIDEIGYEIEHDNIYYRKDNKNEVISNFDYTVDWYGKNIIKSFPWGNNNVYLCKFNNCYLYNFVNFNGSSAYNITVDSLGIFDANNWGIGSNLYNITLEKNSLLYEFNIGDGNNINNLFLGQGSTIHNVSLANNDNSQVAFRNITLGKGYSGMGSDINIFNLNLHRRSKFYNILIEGNGSDSGASQINDLILGFDCSVFDIKLSKGSSFNNVDILSGSTLYNINLEQYSYFGEGNVTAYSTINGIKLGISSNFVGFNLFGESYIGNVELGVSSYFEGVFLSAPSCLVSNIILDNNSYISNIIFNNPNSRLETITLGQGSSLYNINLGTNCSLRFITLNTESNMYNIDLVGDGANIQYIEMGSTCTFSNLHLNNLDNYISQIKLNTNSSFYNITFNGNYSGIDGVELGIYGGVGNLQFGANAYLESIQIGVDAGINSIIFSNETSLYDLTIGENCYLQNNNTINFNGYVYDKIIDKNNNNFPAILDINGLSNIDMQTVRYAGEVTLTSRITTLTYNTLNGTFLVGDTITDDNNGATGVIINDNGSSMTIRVLNKNITFNSGDYIFVGGANAIVDTYVTPQTEIDISYLYNTDEKWPIKFLIEDGLTVTFNGTPVLSASNGVITMPTTNFIAIGDTQDYIVVKQKQNTGKNITYSQLIDSKNYL